MSTLRIGRNWKIVHKLQNILEKYTEKSKGTILEKWALYWKNVIIDYKEAGIDVAKDAKAKPIKAVVILSSLSFLAICAKNNPDERNFRDACLRSANDLFLVSTSTQRKESLNNIRMIETSYNLSALRRMNLGIFSIMWVDDFSANCNTYECNCNYLKVPYSGILDRLVDIGFMNKWWLLEKHMEDYDINY